MSGAHFTGYLLTATRNDFINGIKRTAAFPLVKGFTDRLLFRLIPCAENSKQPRRFQFPTPESMMSTSILLRHSSTKHPRTYVQPSVIRDLCRQNKHFRSEWLAMFGNVAGANLGWHLFPTLFYQIKLANRERYYRMSGEPHIVDCYWKENTGRSIWYLWRFVKAKDWRERFSSECFSGRFSTKKFSSLCRETHYLGWFTNKSIAFLGWRSRCAPILTANFFHE